MRSKSRAPRAIISSGTPVENLSAFVERARKSYAFGQDLDFDARQWEVTQHARQREDVPVRSGRLVVTFEGAGATTVPNTPGECSEHSGCLSMGQFTRAFARLMRNPTHHQLVMVAIAGRHLSAAMKAGCVADVSLCTIGTFDEAWRLAQVGNSPAYAEKLGYQLEAFCNYLNNNLMTVASLASWRFARRSKQRHLDNGETSQAKVEGRLPSQWLLQLIRLSYKTAERPADVIVTRVMLLLLSAPERVNELLALKVHPEVLLRTPSGNTALGLQWTFSKPNKKGIKLIPACMEQAVRSSLADLRRVTQEGRRIKAWYDRHPDKLYLPRQLEHVRGSQRLSAAEVSTLLNGQQGDKLDTHVFKLKIRLLPQSEKFRKEAHRVSFAALEEHFLKILPRRMRDAGGHRAEPLLVVPEGTFRRRRSTPTPCMFQAVTYAQVSCNLKPKRTRFTVFQRLGLDPLREASIRTHDFRRLLNTLVKQGGLSDTDAALWRGVVDTRNGHAYDRRTPAEQREAARRINRQSRRVTGPLARERPDDDEPEGTA